MYYFSVYKYNPCNILNFIFFTASTTRLKPLSMKAHDCNIGITYVLLGVDYCHKFQ